MKEVIFTQLVAIKNFLKFKLKLRLGRVNVY